MLLSRLNVLPLAGLFLTYPSVTLRQSQLTACVRQYSPASPCCLEFAKYIGTWNITNTKKSSKPSIGFLGQQQSRAFHIASAEELVRDNGLAARYVYVGSCPLAYCHLVFPLDWLRKKRTPYMHKANGPSYTTSHWKGLRQIKELLHENRRSHFLDALASLDFKLSLTDSVIHLFRIFR